MAGGPWEEAGWGPPERGGDLAAASPTGSEVKHYYVLSYTKLFLGILVSTNYTWLQVKIFCHNVSLGVLSLFCFSCAEIRRLANRSCLPLGSGQQGLCAK